MRTIFVVLLTFIFLTSCAGQKPLLPTATPVPTAAPTVDSYFRSDGGGDPRTVGYWLLWNTCEADNRAALAAANGGREAGWVLVDDLLLDPGIQVGSLVLENCPQALALLELRSLSGEERSDDPAFGLAAQLLVAQFNLAVGAEQCQGMIEAVFGAQQLLADLGFDGEAVLIGPVNPGQIRVDAELYLEALKQYNQGELCR